MGAVAVGARLPRRAPARLPADGRAPRRRSASPPARRSGRRRWSPRSTRCTPRSSAALLVAALAWSASRRPARLLRRASRCLAAGLGHHTTILAFAPGARAAGGRSSIAASRCRARTLATSAAILALGLLPYALILVRSRDPRGLRRVARHDARRAGAASCSARQFQDRLFTERWASDRRRARAAAVAARLRRRPDLGRPRAGARSAPAGCCGAGPAMRCSSPAAAPS